MAAPYLFLAGFQLWSGLQQVNMIRQQARLSQMIGEQNAKYAEIDAWEAEKYGYTQAARHQSVIDAVVGEQRSAYAAQGVDLNFGTAAQVQEETKLNGFLNQLDMIKTARAKALGLKMQASNFRLGNSMAGAQAEMNTYGYIAGSAFNAGATYLSGYSKPEKSEK